MRADVQGQLDAWQQEHVRIHSARRPRHMAYLFLQRNFGERPLTALTELRLSLVASHAPAPVYATESRDGM